MIQPQAASINSVPTAALRGSAPISLQPVLNAFPMVNCTSSTPNCIADLGNGLGEFVGTWSNPGQFDPISVRLDHNISEKVRIFFRFSDTPSSTKTRMTGSFNSPSDVLSTAYTTRTYTFGLSSVVSSTVSNEFRLNFTSNDATQSEKLDNFGGAQSVDLARLQGINPQSSPTSQVLVPLNFGAFSPAVTQFYAVTSQSQWNLVDSLSLSLGRHQLKFGVDYRRLSPIGKSTTPFMYYQYDSSASVQMNSVDLGLAINTAPAYPIYTNFSAFVQDQWRLTSRLNVSLGLRWEVNPAPGAGRGGLPYTVEGSGDLSTMTLAPQGTPLWKTTWFNLAPRLGAAYVLRNVAGWETIVRGGGGVFFDTGQQLGSQGYAGVGFSSMNFFGNSVPGSPAISFPVPLAQFLLPIVNPPMPVYSPVFAFYPHMQLPYTLQWNASIEQALGKSQALTISYVGASGRRLLEQNELAASSFNPNFGNIDFFQNALTSSYDALQTQIQRRLSNGLQALGSYTWSHSIDYGSSNTALPYIRGNSDFDVRHNFSAALTYDLPSVSHNNFAGALLHHWGLDDRFTARTSFPVNPTGQSFFDPVTGKVVTSELNIVPGEPIYLYGSQYPGGREINPNAFAPAPSGQAGDAPRNFARGFGAWQMDLAVRREFPIHERLRLQFRAEAFNIFNHPNFGTINTTFCPGGPGCTFGQATATLAQSLGVLSPLYQMGGPRSMQFALRLIF